MKQVLNLKEVETPTYVSHFVSVWKRNKGYGEELTVNVGQCIELLIAVSYNFSKENSTGRFFNNALINEESFLGWDGDELIDILFFEVMKNLAMRIRTNKLFGESSL